MESPSGPPCRKRTPRQGPLLTVSLLIFWSRPVTAQLTIESVPADAAEGSDVLLLVHNQPENPQGYIWARSQQDLREPQPPACPPGHGCPPNPASQVPLHDSRAAVPTYEELLNRDTNIYCRINPKAEEAPYFPQRTWAAEGKGQVRPQSLGRS
nr:carcinoembryonic antigen-related cell adhesion molecule 2-like [Dasypus novemcinctus]